MLAIDLPSLYCGLTSAEAKDLDMISQRRFSQGKHRRRKEHGLIVWVSNEQAYSLVAQARILILDHVAGEQ